MGISTLVRAHLPGRCTVQFHPRARLIVLPVRRSLANNDSTVLSIFINPAQFAPHEDYGTYPKTFDHDMKRFRDVLAESNSPTDAIVFLPSVKDMYPSGIVLDVADQKGTFIEVKGYGHQMEGRTRPTFFRGVATVGNIDAGLVLHKGLADATRMLVDRRQTLQRCRGDAFSSPVLSEN